MSAGGNNHTRKRQMHENDDNTTAPTDDAAASDTHTPARPVLRKKKWWPGKPKEPPNTNKTPKKWVKGMESPNKAGRPKNPKNAAEVRELAREKTGAMLEFLSRTALNPKVSIGVRVTCATEILNRGWGKAPQSLDVNHGVQTDLAALLEEIDGRNKIKTITGTVIRPALAIGESILDHGQEREENSIPTELGPRKSSE
jgi:hypothetical protein